MSSQAIGWKYQVLLTEHPNESKLDCKHCLDSHFQADSYVSQPEQLHLLHNYLNKQCTVYTEVAASSTARPVLLAMATLAQDLSRLKGVHYKIDHHLPGNLKNLFI